MSDQWLHNSEEVSVLKFKDRGVLRDLGIDPEEKKKKKKKAKKKKVITIDADVTSKKGGRSRTTPGAADKGLSRVGEKKTGAAGSRSSGSAGSRNPDAGATSSSLAHEEEEEEEEEEEPAAKLISRKRSRETTAEAKKKTPEKKGVVITDPPEPAQKRPKPVGADPKDTGTAATTASDKAQGPKIVCITGLDQPHHEKRKEPEVEKPTKPAPANAPVQTAQVTTTGGSGSGVHKGKTAAAGGASPGGARGFMPQNISPKDTLGDIYYKTYTEESRGNAPHQAPWGLK
ncbi:eukaryotic translation initiation factor 5B-like [Helianthus annuus]|uniref:eukaryotic translation initiation factor 5B-like n=1 Tax=Helianthus annuus TaxID=4232 RepID=UPI001652E0B1|nr:eukaryotic translation initiation factor 5B-like [Helianthus annuus]